jgi:outer membrane protein assembly factor BamB
MRHGSNVFWPAAIGAIGALAWMWLATARGDDWPQWRGPREDGISRESGLWPKWPEKGPPELWRAALGSGFSAVAVAHGRAYTQYGTAEGEFVLALDAATGKTLWKVRSGDLYKNSYGDGPRATPAIDADRVYALGGKGALLCLDAAGGKPVWSLNLLEKFGGETPEYGFAASPIVMGQMLVVVVGAKQGKSLAALEKTTGKVLWTSLDDKPGYSTPLRAEVGGVPQIVVLMGEAVVGVSPQDGHEYWRYPWKTSQDANVATPICHDGRLYISTGLGTGCGLFELSAKEGKPAARPLWANKGMKNLLGTCVLIDGYLYGFDDTRLTCTDFLTGEVKWKERGFNHGSLLAADGKLIIYGERATLALAEINPARYTEISRAQVLDDKTWTVPTLSGGRLFVRNEKELVCLKMTP